MPRPAYVILAKSGAVDQYSNSVSMFDVVETYYITDRPDVSESDHGIEFVGPLRIVAAWMREDGDRVTDLFEGQVACIGPDGTELFAWNCDGFSFTQPICRWNVELPIPGFSARGTHTIEARLRHAGKQKWRWRKTFSFLVQDREAHQEIEQTSQAVHEQYASNPKPESVMRITATQAVQVFQGLQYWDAADFKNDIKILTEKMNAWSEVIEAHRIKKNQEIDVAHLLTKILRALREGTKIEVVADEAAMANSSTTNKTPDCKPGLSEIATNLYRQENPKEQERLRAWVQDAINRAKEIYAGTQLSSFPESESMANDNNDIEILAMQLWRENPEEQKQLRAWIWDANTQVRDLYAIPPEFSLCKDMPLHHDNEDVGYAIISTLARFTEATDDYDRYKRDPNENKTPFDSTSTDGRHILHVLTQFAEAMDDFDRSFREDYPEKFQ